MDTPSNRNLRSHWRVRLFWLWVAASAAVAFYIGIIGPFARIIGEHGPFITLALPALMIFLLATGLGWLVLLVFSKRDRGEGQSKAH